MPEPLMLLFITAPLEKMKLSGTIGYLRGWINLASFTLFQNFPQRCAGGMGHKNGSKKSSDYDKVQRG
jgi:hypothetical protein